MHTDQTLKILDEMTVLIGAEFRAFMDNTCPAFDTKELAREVDARERRNLKKAQDQSKSSVRLESDSGKQLQQRPERRRMKFSLRSYKYHSLGDYANTIRRLGTTDSFSTEPASCDHSYCGYINLSFRAS
jgi:hypothetical protein